MPPNKGQPDRQLPNSYGYNGSVFHEAFGPVSEGDLKEPSQLIFLGESTVGYPDINDGICQVTFQHAGRRSNWLFADQHAKAMKLLRRSPRSICGQPGQPGVSRAMHAWNDSPGHALNRRRAPSRRSEGHQSSVDSLFFTPDGKLLINGAGAEPGRLSESVSVMRYWRANDR